MIKHFYSYHVEIESMEIEIDSLDISSAEKAHLKSLAESHIHHSIMDTILSELAPDDKKTFISHLNTKDHERIWKFLYEKVEDVEDKIKAAATAVKKELHQDLREAKESGS